MTSSEIYQEDKLQTREHTFGPGIPGIPGETYKSVEHLR